MLLTPFVKLGYKGRTDFKKVAIFVQHNNDADTCASAVALAKVLEKKDIESAIYGIKIKYSSVKELKNYKNNRKKDFEVDEDTLAVLVDVNAYKQILEPNWKLIRKCGAIVRIDHHDYAENFEDEMLEILDNTSSCSEIVWQIVKDEIKNYSPEFKKDIAEICFVGIYADTRGLSSGMNQKTFTNLAEIALYTNEFDKLAYGYNAKSVKSNKVIADVINELVVKDKLVIANLRPEIMYKHFPENFNPGERGKINQKTIYTIPLNHLEKHIKADYIIYIHYSLFKPFKSENKFIFVVLNKRNKELEETLIKYGFFKNRNRFGNTEMTFSRLLNFLEENKELFTL